MSFDSAVRRVRVIISILMFGKQRPREKAPGEGLTGTDAAHSSALLCGQLTPAFFILFIIAPLHPFLTSPQLRLCQTIARPDKGRQMGKQC